MDTFRVLTALAELRERVSVMRMRSATSGTFAGGFGKMTLRGGTVSWQFRRRRSIRSETDALVPQRHRVGVVHSTVAILAQERLVRCAIPVRSLNPAHIARPRWSSRNRHSCSCGTAVWRPTVTSFCALALHRHRYQCKASVHKLLYCCWPTDVKILNREIFSGIWFWQALSTGDQILDARKSKPSYTLHSHRLRPARR